MLLHLVVYGFSTEFNRTEQRIGRTCKYLGTGGILTQVVYRTVLTTLYFTNGNKECHNKNGITK